MSDDWQSAPHKEKDIQISISFILHIPKATLTNKWSRTVHDTAVTKFAWSISSINSYLFTKLQSIWAVSHLVPMSISHTTEIYTKKLAVLFRNVSTALQNIQMLHTVHMTTQNTLHFPSDIKQKYQIILHTFPKENLSPTSDLHSSG